LLDPAELGSPSAVTKDSGQISCFNRRPLVQPTTTGNGIFKFADYTYLVVPAVNSWSCLNEIEHLQSWAADNNLKLNRGKSKELIFTTRVEHGHSVVLPPVSSKIK
jgi:hypothetical protein